jgi:hypothetical protein
MRRLTRRPREQPMARRPDDSRTFSVPPAARGLVGWAAVALLLVTIAIAARLIGTAGEDALAVDRVSPSASAAPSAPAIAFGTAIDPVTGEVAASSTTSTFGAGDDFAYSVRPAVAPPATIYVEVLRTGSDPATVQAPAPQTLPEGAALIAFVVPADALLADFGPGDFVMRIFARPTEAPIAVGTFRLAGAPASSG